jgi:CelD/BcsL family acetyltransferase involved in cellulose biosynthesis
MSGATLTQEAAGSLPLEVNEITDFAQLKQLEPVWNQILIETGRPVLYLTYEWLTTWWKCHGDKGKQLYVLVVTDGHEVLGIAPFMKIRRLLFGLPAATIEFISMMKHAFSAFNCSGSLDVIVRNRHEEVFKAVFDHLARQRHKWRVLRLHPIARDSQTLDYVEKEIHRRGYHYDVRRVFANTYVTVESDWESYMAQRSSHLRRNLRRAEQKLRQKGLVQYREYRSLDELENGFDDILAIERKSWKWKHGLSINASAYREFFKAVAEECSKRGWLRLWIIAVGSHKIAYQYWVQYGGTVEGLKTSYDVEYEKYSPGFLVEWRVLEKLFREGVKKINMLAGDTEFKIKWATDQEPHCEVLIFNDGWYSRLLYFVSFRLFFYRAFRALTLLAERMPWRGRVRKIKMQTNKFLHKATRHDRAWARIDHVRKTKD